MGVSFDQAPQVPYIYCDKFNLIGGGDREYVMERQKMKYRAWPTASPKNGRNIEVYSIRLPWCDWLKNIHHNFEACFLIEDNREKKPFLLLLS